MYLRLQIFSFQWQNWCHCLEKTISDKTQIDQFFNFSSGCSFKFPQIRFAILFTTPCGLRLICRVSINQKLLYSRTKYIQSILPTAEFLVLSNLWSILVYLIHNLRIWYWLIIHYFEVLMDYSSIKMFPTDKNVTSSCY